MTAPLIDTLFEIAQEAAHVVNEVYEKPFSVDYKGPADPVTEADRRANQLICERLHALFPEIPIVAEESDEASFAGFRASDRVFFVDPVDGTREFVEHNGQFVIMIGLLEGDRATHGVVYAPAEHRAWLGQVGVGAFQVSADGSRSAISVSQERDLSKARIVASRSHRTADMERALAELGAGEIVALGSAGLKGAAVARGTAGAYVAPNISGKRWDACAVDAIVCAAGGRFTDEYGQAIDYRGGSLVNDRGVVASNALLHEVLLDRLKAWRERRDGSEKPGA